MKVVEEYFPAEVALPDGDVLRRTRTFITDAGIIVATEEQRGVALLAFTDRHVAPPDIVRHPVYRHRRATVHTQAGDVFVTGVNLCQCGLPALRRLTFDEVVRMTREEGRAGATAHV